MAGATDTANLFEEAEKYYRDCIDIAGSSQPAFCVITILPELRLSGMAVCFPQRPGVFDNTTVAHACSSKVSNQKDIFIFCSGYDHVFGANPIVSIKTRSSLDSGASCLCQMQMPRQVIF